MAKEKMTLKTFGSSDGRKIKTDSLLKDSNLDALNLEDSAQKAELDKKRKAIFNVIDNIPNYTAANPSPKVSVIYDPSPDIFKSEHEVGPTLNSDMAAEKADKAAAWRHKTKHRIVQSVVNCWYPDAKQAPFPIKLTTACAPNFMGTSPKDEAEFLTGGTVNTTTGKTEGKHFKPGAEKKYKTLMTLLFRRLLCAQSGNDVIIMPFFGGGVYLDILDAESKKIARQMIHEAFRDALALEKDLLETDKYPDGSQKRKVKEIIYALPDEYEGTEVGRSEAYNGAEKAFEGYMGPPPVSLCNANMFDVANHFAQENKKKIAAGKPNETLNIGMINPGSDRTIGGGYRKTKDGDPPSPLEEQIFNYTDACKIQCLDINQRTNFQLYEFPPAYQQDKNPSMSSDPDIIKKNFNKSEMNAIDKLAKEKNMKVEKHSPTEWIVVLKKDGEEDQRYTMTPTKISGDENTKNYDLMVELALKAKLNQPNLILRHPDPAELKKMQEACVKHCVPYKIAQNADDFIRLVGSEIENKNRPKIQP